MLNGIVPEPEGSAARDALARSSGAAVIYQQADIADLAQIERLVAAAAARFGGVDILVNNAVVRHFAPVEQLTPAEWEQSLAVNLSAPFHLVRLVLPMMRARGFGRILNLSSYYGVRGAENRIGYVTTKTALIGMTRAIALEAGDMDITCNAICPGTLPTPDILGRIGTARRRAGHRRGRSDTAVSRRPQAGRAFRRGGERGGADRLPVRPRRPRHHRRRAPGRWRLDRGLSRLPRKMRARILLLARFARVCASDSGWLRVARR